VGIGEGLDVGSLVGVGAAKYESWWPRNSDEGNLAGDSVGSCEVGIMVGDFVGAAWWYSAWEIAGRSWINVGDSVG
jgi:hypothetical protein